MRISRLASLLMVLGLITILALPGMASAGTVAQGKIWTFTWSMAPESYTPYSGNLSAGGEMAFAISSDHTIDVFVFNQAQYDQYLATGIDTPGYDGPAIHSYLDTTRVEALLTAPATDRYYLVIDNTVAGADPGTSSKAVTLQIVYPITAIVTDALALFGAMLLICGIILLVILIGSVIDLTPKKLDPKQQ